MNDQSSLFSQKTSSDSEDVISSAVLQSGTTRSNSPDGQKTAKSGPVPAPVSPSPSPAKAKRSTIRGTFGQSSFGSSEQDDRLWSLASRYRALTDSLGSTVYAITWSTRVTPGGRSIPAQRASVRRTKDNGCTGWPTPNLPSGGPNSKSTATHAGGMDLDGAATLSAFSAPMLPVDAGTGIRSTERGGCCPASGAATLQGWPTARAEDAESSGMRHGRGVADTMTAVASLAGCKTPCVPNGGRISGNKTNIGAHRDGTKAQIGLENEARLVGWATPAARDWKSGDASQETLDRNARPLSELAKLVAFPTNPDALDVARILNLGPRLQSLVDSGITEVGFLLDRNGWEIVPASGQLNPAHSRWLMGLPPVWDACAVTAMELSRLRRRRS